MNFDEKRKGHSTQLTDKTPKPWPINGYAPGDYLGKCGGCDALFDGDKRATTCLECAVDDLIKCHDQILGALKKHHSLQSEAEGIFMFYVNEKNSRVENVDISLEYQDSTLCETTTAILNKYKNLKDL